MGFWKFSKFDSIMSASIQGGNDQYVDIEVDDGISQEILSIEEYGKLYKVIIHNDHYTSMDFVVKILIEHFDKNFDQAHRVMIYVHQNGKAIAGMYSKEIAETKILMVKRLAEENEFPLTLTMEKNY